LEARPQSVDRTRFRIFLLDDHGDDADDDADDVEMGFGSLRNSRLDGRRLKVRDRRCEIDFGSRRWETESGGNTRQEIEGRMQRLGGGKWVGCKVEEVEGKR